MKKVLFVIAMVFASFSSSIALAGSQSYTSPWRFPNYEQGGDDMYVNINTYTAIQLSGTFYPSVSYPDSYTYCDFSFYHFNSSPATAVGHLYSYIYGAWTFNDPYFSYDYPVYQNWETVAGIMNVSNGYATMTINW